MCLDFKRHHRVVVDIGVCGDFGPSLLATSWSVELQLLVCLVRVGCLGLSEKGVMSVSSGRGVGAVRALAAVVAGLFVVCCTNFQLKFVSDD